MPACTRTHTRVRAHTHMHREREEDFPLTGSSHLSFLIDIVVGHVSLSKGYSMADICVRVFCLHTCSDFCAYECVHVFLCLCLSKKEIGIRKGPLGYRRTFTDEEMAHKSEGWKGGVLLCA